MSAMQANRARNIARYDSIVNSGNSSGLYVPKGYRDNVSSTTFRSYSNNEVHQQTSQGYASAVSCSNATGCQGYCPIPYQVYDQVYSPAFNAGSINFQCNGR
jgi:hypothetical protein